MLYVLKHYFQIEIIKIIIHVVTLIIENLSVFSFNKVYSAYTICQHSAKCQEFKIYKVHIRTPLAHRAYKVL